MYKLEDQIRLEEEMRAMTVQRFNRRMDNAASRGEFTETNVGRGVACHLEDAMMAAIEEFQDQSNKGNPGRRHVAARMLSDIDVPTVAFLTTKAVLNSLRLVDSRKGIGTTVQALAFTISSICHDEIRMRHFEQNNRKLIRALFRDFDKRDMPRRRRKELVQRTMSKLQMEWQQPGWEKQERLHFGVRMIELFREATGVISFADLRAGTPAHRKIVVPTESLIEAVEKRIDHYQALFTVYLPTIIKPRAWENHNLFGGGYYTHNATPYPLVKDAKKPQLEELENTDLTTVLEAVNAIQDTSWRVNQKMLEVTEWAYERHAERVGFPSSSTLEAPDKPANADTDEEVSKEYRKQCYLTHDTNRRNVVRRLSILQGLSIARKMSGYGQFYFPHYLDSRGRAYPKPAILNPQGPDYIKAMLEFAEPKPIEDGSEAHAWVMVAAANAYGEDKLSLQGRIDWAEQNAEMILSVGSDPMADFRWMDADEPFCFLRCALELHAVWKAGQEGRVHQSFMPVAVDATCSGIQHFSAMLRDEVGGEAVNLRTSDQRQDVYQRVADLVIAKMEKDKLEHEDLEVRAKADAALRSGVDRKLTKRSTMIVPYNGTFHACMSYIDEHYRGLAGEPYTPMNKFIPYVARHVWDAIAETVVASREAMDWLTKVAAAASKSSHALPMSWVTPAGFPVRQVCYEREQVRVRTWLDGKSTKLSYVRDTAAIDAARMRSSVAPNFVHSMDAAHLQLTISVCRTVEQSGDSGPMSFAMVHDSFGVHAADMPLFGQILRKSFHWMYTEHDVLEEFYDSNLPVIDEEHLEAIPEVPAKGSLDLDEVLTSDFFFS